MYQRDRLPYCVCANPGVWKAGIDTLMFDDFFCANCTRLARYMRVASEHVFLISRRESQSFSPDVVAYMWERLFPALRLNAQALSKAREAYEQIHQRVVCSKAQVSPVNHWNVLPEDERDTFLLNLAGMYARLDGEWWHPSEYQPIFPPEAPSSVKVLYRSEVVDFIPTGKRARWHEL